MSSARANAAARSRQPQQQQSPQQQNGKPATQQQPNNLKLSISDAIALITLRLGRVEQIVQTMPVDDQSNISRNNLDDNVRIVDDAVFVNIIQRLDAIEKYQQKEVKQPSQMQQLPQPPMESSTNYNNETIDNFKTDILNLKDLLLQLQSFTMQTNQRLTDTIFIENDLLKTNEYCDDNNENNDNINNNTTNINNEIPNTDTSVVSVVSVVNLSEAGDGRFL